MEHSPPRKPLKRKEASPWSAAKKKKASLPVINVRSGEIKHIGCFVAFSKATDHSIYPFMKPLADILTNCEDLEDGLLKTAAMTIEAHLITFAKQPGSVNESRKGSDHKGLMTLLVWLWDVDTSAESEEEEKEKKRALKQQCEDKLNDVVHVRIADYAQCCVTSTFIYYVSNLFLLMFCCKFCNHFLALDTTHFKWPVRFASVGHQTVDDAPQESASDLLKQQDIIYCLGEMYPDEIRDRSLFDHTKLLQELFPNVEDPAMMFHDE